ncbi:hypothetical protein DFJ43DRAFT_1007143 [Lentinula guzmanii]|uniref:Uncharacterized protein n=1 Tax=Lentinula guzmanii TaxID=2804957 RepID=A0AA38JAG2_9AGAR|nr:hypothetical protein DFJ43DRAFT_1007143 [Lentinula guzmanii]
MVCAPPCLFSIPLILISLKNHARQCYRSLTGQPKINDFAGYSPVDEDTVTAFEDGEGLGPQEGDFRLHLGDGWHQSAWNHAIIAAMAETMLCQAREQSIDPILTSEAVKAMIWDYVKQAQNLWSTMKPRVHESGECIETQLETLSRSNQYQSRRMIAVRSNTCKSLKYKERRKGLLDLLSDPSQSTIATKRWQTMSAINDALHHEGQSSEDTDCDCEHPLHQAPPLKVTQPHCRCCVIGDLMADLDVAIDRACVENARASGKRYIPRPSRVRIRTGEKSECTVKRGLPRALYHRRYLQGLNPAVVSQLKPSDVEIPGFAQYTVGVELDSMEE